MSRTLFISAVLLTMNALAAEPAAPASIESASTGARFHLSAEIDPLDYTLYRGWGGFIDVKHDALSHWRFRLGGGAASLPSFVVDQTPENKGWGVRLDPVATLVAHYFPFSGRGGFFVGPVAGYVSMRFDAPADGGSTHEGYWFPGVDLGYRWYPSDKLGLVISPHLGAIINLYGAPTVGGATYKSSPVIPQPQVLIGWEFDV